MVCSGCAHRRQALGEAAKAIRAGRPQQLGQQIEAAGKSLSEDAKAFARDLKVRLINR